MAITQGDVLKGPHTWDGHQYVAVEYVHQEFPKDVDGGTTIVHNEEEYKAWLAENRPAGPSMPLKSVPYSPPVAAVIAADEKRVRKDSK